MRLVSDGLKEKIKHGKDIVGFRLESLPPNKILIGTHHKTGTVWLRKIFSRLSKELGLKFYSSGDPKIPTDADIILNNHSRFNNLEELGPFRGLHVIRDPRDIIVSGCFYHQKSAEAWLHVKRERLNGLTYQQALLAKTSLEDKISFEMEALGRTTIQDIINWDYNDARFLNIKYEDLMSDVDLKVFHDIFLYLGLNGGAIPTALYHAYKGSLFSGQVKGFSHVRSGEARQWERFFSKNNRERFVELFGSSLIDLGYENDHSWIKREMQRAGDM